MPLPAKRGKYSCLDVFRFEEELDIRTMSFVKGSEDMRSRETER